MIPAEYLGTRYRVIATVLFVALLLVGILSPTDLHAQYVVGPTVISGGGARMTGGSYVVTCTTGQSSPVGVSSGGVYVTSHGFWHAVTGGSTLGSMLLEIVRLNSTTARLSWATVTGATFYDLYRSTTPFFNATGSPWRTVSAPGMNSDFSAGIGNENTNYFFRGIARNATQISSQSNIVGEFDFASDVSFMGKGESQDMNGSER